MVAHVAALVFGLLGNIISFLVFLAPVPTFYRICRKKCTEGFQSFPYLVALFSASLWIYYAILKGINGNTLYLVTINLFGCFIESIYIILFIIYAPKKAKILTIKLFVLLNVGIFCCILFPTLLLAQGAQRLKVLGWICGAFAIAVSAAPLSIMWLVIRTKSVEFMPFFLSLFITLSAVMWFGYGLLIKDKFVAYPNVLGIAFGTVQMILYGIYKRKENALIIITDEKLPEVVINMTKLGTVGGRSEVYPVIDPNLVDEAKKVTDLHCVDQDAKISNDHKADDNLV